jgi:hypothetical protein
MRSVLQFFVMLAGNNGIRLLALDAVPAGFAGFGVWRQWRASGRSLNFWGRIVVFSWLIVPVALVLLVSMVRPIFLARYLPACLPAAILVVAAGIDTVKPRILAWIFAAAISIFPILGVSSYYRQDFDLERDDWRSATAYVLDHAGPGDGAFFYQNFGRLPFEFYRSQKHPSPVWPAALVSANGADWAYRDSLFAYLGQSLQDAGPGGNRVWLILDLDRGADGKPNMESTILRAAFGKGRHLVDEEHISQITILLFARNASNPI